MLPQSEVTGNEEDYHHKTYNVNNTVHLSSFLLSPDRIYFVSKLELILIRGGLQCSIEQFEISLKSSLTRTDLQQLMPDMIQFEHLG